MTSGDSGRRMRDVAARFPTYLSVGDVPLVIRSLHDGRSVEQVAREFGTTPSVIADIDRVFLDRPGIGAPHRHR